MNLKEEINNIESNKEFMEKVKEYKKLKTKYAKKKLIFDLKPIPISILWCISSILFSVLAYMGLLFLFVGEFGIIGIIDLLQKLFLNPLTGLLFLCAVAGIPMIITVVMLAMIDYILTFAYDYEKNKKEIGRK